MAIDRKPISLRKDLSQYAENIAHKYFQDNFSMFVAYLISCHKEGNLNIFQQHAMQQKQEIPQEEVNTGIIDDIENYFDN